MERLWKDAAYSLFHSLSFQHKNHAILLYISGFQGGERSLENIFL
jgi:hypothetical protein